MTIQLRCTEFRKLPHNQEQIMCTIVLNREDDSNTFDMLIDSHRDSKWIEVKLGLVKSND